ncbi:MAG TPA: glycosyltransferase, partial [Usitatibacteraceae bacterium]|nr:glycosyltransferase [Usitatibacteraceae bacterium]
PFNASFKDLSTPEWIALRRRFADLVIARRLQVVVPSPSVAATLKRLEPRFAEVTMHVIAHGIDLEGARVPAPKRAKDDRLRLVVLGRHTELKGASLLREAAADLQALADITLLGCGKAGMEDARTFGWRAVERYEPAQLPGLLRECAPHAGLLASVIPETFSYTLSELLALGIPPLATALGSFCDRIADGENGFLFAPDSRSLVKAVKRLHGDPALLASVALRLAGAPPARTTAQMLAQYEPLLPRGTREVARFPVGRGWQSGLTEPYRQLTEAYAQLTRAYAESHAAYEQTREAYEQVRAAYDGIMKEAGGRPKPKRKETQG